MNGTDILTPLAEIPPSQSAVEFLCSKYETTLYNSVLL